jgi:hypothetical protein
VLVVKGDSFDDGVMGCHGALSRLDPASEQWFVSHRHERQRDRTVILAREVELNPGPQDSDIPTII